MRAERRKALRRVKRPASRVERRGQHRRRVEGRERKRTKHEDLENDECETDTVEGERPSLSTALVGAVCTVRSRLSISLVTCD
jgi:hypothetical protein